MSQGGMVLLMRCWGFQWYTGISWCRRGSTGDDLGGRTFGTACFSRSYFRSKWGACNAKLGFAWGCACGGRRVSWLRRKTGFRGKF